MGISTFTSKEFGPFFAGYLADWQCLYIDFNQKHGGDGEKKRGCTRCTR
jgi:hypothetical protein